MLLPVALKRVADAPCEFDVLNKVDVPDAGASAGAVVPNKLVEIIAGPEVAVDVVRLG